ncbi:MAG: PEP-CTERM sorting domain-containing protein [Pirellulales bacterium]
MRDMYREVWCLALWAVLGLNACTSEAGLIEFSIDLIPGNGAGVIDTTRTVGLGQNFTVDLLGTLTTTAGTPATLSIYGVSVQYDTAPLDLNPAGSTTAATEALPAADVFGVAFPAPGGAFSFNLDAGVTGATESVGGGKGQVSTFEAGTFGAGPDTTNQSSITFLVGSINFTATALGTSTLTPGAFNVGFDGFSDNLGGSVVPTFNSGTITVTPEPGSLMLMGLAAMSSLCGYGLRRRRKQKQTT